MHKTLTFEIDIHQSPALIYDHLANPKNFLGLQPLLIDMSPIDTTSEDGKTVCTYETIEAFRMFGKIVYRNRIRVRSILTRPPEQMDTVVHSPGGVTLNVEYLFQAKGNGTHLIETMHIQGYRLLMSFVIDQATKAQNTVLHRLKARLEKA